MRLRSVAMGLATLFVTSGAKADPEGPWIRDYTHMAWGGGYGMLGGLMMLVFWGVVIVLVFFAVRWLTDNKSGAHTSKAIDVLKDRFAKGEIDEDEYRKRKAALEE